MTKKLGLASAIALLIFGLLAGNAVAINFSPTADGNTLVNTIVGGGITTSNITYNGALSASGTFINGLSSGIGIDEGIVLTSGDASLIDNTNNSDSAGQDNNLPGDADLDSLVPSDTTFDATILEFDFETATGDLFFNFVFGSEEYNEYTNTGFNDVFGFFVDGQNLALIPGTTTPVSINTVNGGNPLGTDASNPDLFNNNDLNDSGPFFAFEYDGFTNVFTASLLGLTEDTEYNIKLAIADAGDPVLDSGVFIEAGTFSGTEPPGVPEPTTLLLLGFGLAGLAIGREKFLK